MERKETDKFTLTYSEFFNYLPPHALNMAIDAVIQLIQQMGWAPDKIVRMENGIRVQVSDDFSVATFPFIEILLQNKYINEAEIKRIFESITNIYQIFSDLMNFYWEWNYETESQFNDFFAILYKVMQEHPSAVSEIQAVVEKYRTRRTGKTLASYHSVISYKSAIH